MDIVELLNGNQGVVAVVGTIIVAGVSFWIYKKQSKHSNNESVRHNNSSPFIKAGRSITAGGDISVGNSQTVVNPAQGIPELHLQLYGSGAKQSFDGHIEKKSDVTLVVLFVEIGGIKTNINRQFTKLLPLKDFEFSSALFKEKVKDIDVVVRYRTLSGDAYEYTQKAEQQPRADGRFNVALTGTPSIRKVILFTPEEKELISEAQKHDGQIYHLATDQLPNGWVRVGKKDFYFEDDQQKTRNYLTAFNHLVELGHVQHKSGKLYLLSPNLGYSDSL